MPQETERTRLLQDARYVFDTSVEIRRKRRVRQFQCCLCAIFICIFAIVMVITVAYTIHTSNDAAANNSEVESFNVLISLPLADKTIKRRNSNETKIKDAITAGELALRLKDETEKKLSSLLVDSPSYRHQMVTATSERARNLSRQGYVEEFATRHFGEIPEKICYCNISTLQCNFNKFRSYNGSCNNLKRPNDFGVAYKPFRRALPPDYADGISQPRSRLPSARTVSLEVHRPYYRDDDKFSVMLAVWGQFLDHDITATALSRSKNGSSISCCKQTHPECFPVKIESFDPFARFNISCMEFVRSAPAPTCCLGPREQMNQASAFIDASVIYGVDNDTVAKLRKFQSGELKMFITEDNRTLLPISSDLNDGCNRKKESEKGRYCFLTGDARANENLHLTSMHLIWARQHNFIARKLSKLNPVWDDGRIFEEVRRILGAQMQHITYGEFLPILLGKEVMENHELTPKTRGYFLKYNDSIDPSIANSFATAAFRFAHSIIPGLMKLLANDTSSPEFVLLHKMLFDPFKLYEPGEMDRALRGAMDTTIEASDPYFTEELKQHLFEDDSKPKQYGLDLVSLNIQRGRDHGLVGYNSWREHCGLRRVRTFKQLREDIDDDSLSNIQSVYRDLEDVDLYTGALSERPLNGSILGPTLTCLILDQFFRIKFGDRFWYENPKVFTPLQLNEIRKTTLAKIICNNADNVRNSQPFVMEKIRKGNEVTSCNDLPELDLEPWKEKLAHVRMSTPEVAIIKV